MPQEVKNSILSLLPQPEPNLPDGGSKGLSSPEVALRELAGGGGGGRCSGERSSGESPDKVSCTVVGEAAQPALPVGVHFGGKVGGGGPSYL